MGESRTKFPARGFPLWELFWWVTFIALGLGMVKASGSWLLFDGLAVCMLLLSLPWLDRTGPMTSAPERRWFRFGLRTMLVLVALLAMILGYSVSRFAAERNAVEKLLARGGKVVYHDNAYGRIHPERTLKAWFLEFAGLRWPGEAYLGGKEVTDEVLRDEILPLRTLTAVGMTSVSVTNEGLGQLRSLKSLATVTCLRDGRNEKVLRELAEPSMVEMRSVPLRDAMDYLTDLHDIKIQIDPVALQESKDAAVTCKLKNLRLSVTLDQLLAPLNLGWIVDNGRLVITTRKVVEAHAQEAAAVNSSLPQVKTLIIDSDR